MFDKQKNQIVPFENKVWLSSPTMHGDELKYMTEAFETNWMSTVGANIDAVEKELAEKIAASLAGREQLLKLLAMNNYDMEANSRPERLVAFKESYGRSLGLMRELLLKFCPDMGGTEIRNFIYIFFPFMFGIYPYTAVTEKQKTAMKDAGIDYVYQTVYELTHSCLIRLLGE